MLAIDRVLPKRPSSGGDRGRAARDRLLQAAADASLPRINPVHGNAAKHHGIPPAGEEKYGFLPPKAL